MNDVVIEKNRGLIERETWTKAGPVVTRMPDDEVMALEERAMATVGDPSPMGLWAFATGTWIVGTVIGGAFGAPAAATAQAAGTAAAAAMPGAQVVTMATALSNPFSAVVPVLLFFTGVAQFIAGLFAYRRTSPLMATAFCCFGAFAVSAAFAFLMQAWGYMPTPMNGTPQVLLGFLYESFGFIAIALAFAAVGVNLASVAWLLCACVGFVLAGIPNLANAQTGGWMVIGNIGGWFLVASAFFAYYLGMALIVNSGHKRPMLPIGGKAC